jgi:hypothetical protein
MIRPSKIFLLAEHIALTRVHGTVISPGFAIVLKVFGGLLLSNVAKPTGSPFQLKEKFLMNNALPVKQIAMFILFDPTCLTFFESGEEGLFS